MITAKIGMLLAATLLIIGCSIEFDLDDDEEKVTPANTFSGTWYGTRTVVIDNAFDGFQARQDGTYELYMVIRDNGNGTLEIPNCYGEFETVAIQQQAFIFRDKKFLILDESQISGSYLRDEVYSTSHYYTSVLEEWIKVSENINPIGSLQANWLGYETADTTSDVYCAEIGSFHFTSSRGDNITQFDAAVSDGSKFSYWRTTSGTDNRKFFSLMNGDRRFFGFNDLGKSDMEISYQREQREGASVVFSATEDDTKLGASGKVVINPLLSN